MDLSLYHRESEIEDRLMDRSIRLSSLALSSLSISLAAKNNGEGLRLPTLNLPTISQHSHLERNPTWFRLSQPRTAVLLRVNP